VRKEEAEKKRVPV